MESRFKVGDKVLCWDGCPGVVNAIDMHEGQIRYDVTFGGGVDFGYYREKELVEYHKPKYITGDFVGIYGYETDVKIQQMKWDGAGFMYKVYLADEEEWITADEIAYKVETNIKVEKDTTMSNEDIMQVLTYEEKIETILSILATPIWRRRLNDDTLNKLITEAYFEMKERKIKRNYPF